MQCLVNGPGEKWYRTKRKIQIKDHKILKFPMLQSSVKAYMKNLNTHRGYKEFREERDQT